MATGFLKSQTSKLRLKTPLDNNGPARKDRRAVTLGFELVRCRSFYHVRRRIEQKQTQVFIFDALGTPVNAPECVER